MTRAAERVRAFVVGMLAGGLIVSLAVGPSIAEARRKLDASKLLLGECTTTVIRAGDAVRASSAQIVADKQAMSVAEQTLAEMGAALRACHGGRPVNLGGIGTNAR